MRKIPLTKDKSAIVDDEDFEWLIQYNWKYSRGYAIYREYLGKKPNGITRWGKTIMMHRLVNNTPNGMDTDHINRNTLDNRKKNLRTTTRSQNMANARGQIGKSSKYKGVYLDRGMWRAAIQHKKLGYFKDEISAVKAYNKAAIEAFGEFARLNIIDDEAAA